MKANYNRVSFFYDRLSRLVFGTSIIEAQQFLVNFIPVGSTVLIVGGGTGWILEEITKKHPSGLEVVYIDLSEKMISLSKKRKVGTNKVLFLTGDINLVVLHQKFDLVLTPFILDNFSEETVAVVFDKIHRFLLPGAMWLFADFQVTRRGGWWQKPLLQLMYAFFKTLCHVEAGRLPDTDSIFRKYGYRLIASNTFFSAFICSSVYAHSSHSGMHRQ